jgi:hypothetical protein
VSEVVNVSTKEIEKEEIEAKKIEAKKMKIENEMEREKMRLANGAYRTNHILHLILSVVTGGIWIIVWVLVWARNRHNEYKAEKIAFGESSFPVISFVVLVFFGIIFITIIGGILSASGVVPPTPMP